MVSKNLQNLLDPKSLFPSKVDPLNLKDQRLSSRLSKKSMAKFVSLTVRNALSKYGGLTEKERDQQRSNISMKAGMKEEAIEEWRSFSHQ